MLPQSILLPRLRPEPRPARHAALWAGLLAALTGCEWVLDGIPELPGGALPDAAPADAALPDGGHTPADGGLHPDAGPFPIPDGGPVVVPGSDGGPGDAGPPDAAGPDAAPCQPGAFVYVDRDRDGYGTGLPTLADCGAGLSYATLSGDCDDDNIRVFPGQLKYFGAPYRGADGLESFDYDCSGSEEDSGRQQLFSSCGLLGAAGCQGSGYAPTRRTGSGVNPGCGSALVQTCTPQLLGTLSCIASPGQSAEPYVCR